MAVKWCAPIRPPRSNTAKHSPLLTLDLGNTSLKVLLWEQGVVTRRWRTFLSTAGLSTAGQSTEGQSTERLSGEGLTIDGSAGERDAGGLPDLDGIREARGVRVPGQREPELPSSWPKVLWAGESLLLPGQVQYARPLEMGADRRVAAWGARSLHGSALVLDCGTALTLTHVNELGEIRGLGISAGYRTLREGLAQAAPALSGFLSEDRPVPEGIPEGSAENLSLGMTVGWAGLLRELLLEARERLASPHTLVLTGSDAPLAAMLLGEGKIEAELLHIGLLALEMSD